MHLIFAMEKPSEFAGRDPELIGIWSAWSFDELNVIPITTTPTTTNFIFTLMRLKTKKVDKFL